MDNQLINRAKNLFLKKLKENEDPWNLEMHLREAEKWAKRALHKYPEAQENVIMLTVWLHDIGYFMALNEDHAILSEKVAKEFLLEQKADASLVENVLHCIRSHRNKDVKPKSFESKLFVMIDSISHFTWLPYIAMAQDGRTQQGLEKLERDYRDIQFFPEMVEEIRPLYTKLKDFLIEFNKVGEFFDVA